MVVQPSMVEFSVLASYQSDIQKVCIHHYEYTFWDQI